MSFSLRPAVRLQDGSSKLQLQMMGGQYSTAKISSEGSQGRDREDFLRDLADMT